MSTSAISAMTSNGSSLTNNANSAAPGAPGSERDLFMTLLVAQLKNQDPLAPQDGTAFVAQLAQFNSLDQLVGIRQALDALTALMEQNPPVNTTTSASV